jgi:hypothetical protein
LELYLADESQSWELDAVGNYTERRNLQNKDGEVGLGVQQTLLELLA